MGTDIHLYVEKLVDGAWCVVPPPERDLARWPKKEKREYGWGPHGCMRATFRECYYGFGLDEEGCPGASCPACLGTGKDLRWYSNRNYDVFAVLADVRNGRGFAGCDTGDGFEVTGIGVVRREHDLAGLWETYLRYVETYPAAAAKLLLCLRREADRLRAPAAVPYVITDAGRAALRGDA